MSGKILKHPKSFDYALILIQVEIIHILPEIYWTTEAVEGAESVVLYYLMVNVKVKYEFLQNPTYPKMFQMETEELIACWCNKELMIYGKHHLNTTESFTQKDGRIMDMFITTVNRTKNLQNRQEALTGLPCFC